MMIAWLSLVALVEKIRIFIVMGIGGMSLFIILVNYSDKKKRYTHALVERFEAILTAKKSALNEEKQLFLERLETKQTFPKDWYNSLERFLQKDVCVDSTDRWILHKHYNNTPALVVVDRALDGPLLDTLIVQERTTHRHLLEFFREDMTGKEYEHYCASVGWKADVTQATRDFGLDIKASRPELTLAIQCKRSKSNVGIKAVQEALGAKAYIKAHVALVVSNSGYTSSAQEMAKKTGVLLLHYRDLLDLDPHLPHH